MSAPPGAWACAGKATQVLRSAPFPFIAAGVLFLLVTGSVPIIGTLLGGPMWVGLCMMAIAGLRGEPVSLEQLFAPFSGERLGPSLLLGGVIALLLFLAGLPAMLLTFSALFSMLGAVSSGLQLDPAAVLGGVAAGSLLGVLLTLLALVLVAYYLLPAGYFIAVGETDGWAAMRRSIQAVNQRRVFWSGFWGVMTLGHAVAMLTCCVGMLVVFPWNSIAVVAALENAAGRGACPPPPRAA